MHLLRAKSGPWPFFVFVFGWTWFFWGVAIGLQTSVQSAAGQMLLRLGLAGPMLGGIAFAWLTHDRGYWRDYWHRIVDVRRVPARWWLVILLFVPMLMAAAVLLDVATGGSATLVLIRQRVTPAFLTPSIFLPAALAVLINGPFPEELGWRGYALDQLQARWSAAASSLFLGVIWAIWHLPLFLMNGMVHASKGPAWIALFLVDVVATAVILTWIFNNTRRSTLGAIVFHFMANVAYGIGNASDAANLYATLLWIVAAAAVLAWWRAGALARQ